MTAETKRFQKIANDEMKIFAEDMALDMIDMIVIFRGLAWTLMCVAGVSTVRLTLSRSVVEFSPIF